MIIEPYDFNSKESLEKQYCIELEKEQKYNLINLRRGYKDWKVRKNGDNFQIWVINDRKNKAGDNGEYFFRYLCEIKPKKIKFYFGITKNCTDYNRLKKYGNVIDFDSVEYLKIFLRTDKIISSISDSWVYNPFGEDGKYMSDLFHFDFIYLQNGIIKDDLSLYLNRIIKNFRLLIISSKREYKSLLKSNYGYKKKNVVLTGLSRFDNLEKYKNIAKKENIILIFPTWRNYIKGTMDLITHESIQTETFKTTNYFNFYNNLINNEKFLSFINNSNYRGIFCLHHNFEAQWRYFNQNKLFKLEERCNLQELLIKSSLLITDYSSISFDFGYIQKPVIFTHFDYEEYRNRQYHKGYFDYQKDGFGPICYDMECTIKTAITEINNNCELKKKYFMRIKKFFRYFDNKNNYRIYNEIIHDENKNPIFINKIGFFSFINIIIIKLLFKKLIK